MKLFSGVVAGVLLGYYPNFQAVFDFEALFFA